MASKQVIALAERIKAEFGIDADPERFLRTYAGHWQRAAGAYTWIMYYGKFGVIGGCEPIRKYISKRNRLVISSRGFLEYEVYAYVPDESTTTINRVKGA